MKHNTTGLLAGLFLAMAYGAQAGDIRFCGDTWTVRSGRGGPGPNTWDPKNVWLDSATNLHLKISLHEGQWSCAEITMQNRLGFDQYQFQTVGRLDRLDDNVVLGLFNYPTGEVGPDGTHEIGIEFARWGKASNPMGNFTVWPAERGRKQVTKAFPFTLTGDETSHHFTWSREQILFQSFSGYREAELKEFARWLCRPQEPARVISQKPMPVHINLWLFKGQAPKNGQEVEVIIRGFRYAPE